MIIISSLTIVWCPLGEWLHLVPRWHPGSYLLSWWLCPSGISQWAKTLVFRDQPRKPDYLRYLDPRWPAGKTHTHTHTPTELWWVRLFHPALCQLLNANRCRSVRFSFATFSKWTCHSEGKTGPEGRSSVSDSKHPLTWMGFGFVRLCFCFHAVKLSAQVGHYQTFSLYMCLSLFITFIPFMSISQSCFPCDTHFSWLCASFYLSSPFYLCSVVFVLHFCQVFVFHLPNNPSLFHSRCCLVLQMDRW